MSNQIVLSIVTASLLLPAMWRRHERRSAKAKGERLAAVSRRGRLVVLAVSSVLVVGAVGGSAFAQSSTTTAPTAPPAATYQSGDRTGSTVSVGAESVLPSDTPADQQIPALADAIAKDRTSINTVWLMVGGILVLFMQAGFALVETGFTRAKNAVHTMMMNMVIFALGVVGWFVCGYALMFGASGQQATIGLNPLGDPIHIGSWNVLAKSGFFLTGHAYDTALLGFFFFQLVFMDATATIPRISSTPIERPSGMTRRTSAWVPAIVVVQARQFPHPGMPSDVHCRAAAKHNAATERPDPGGPVISQACVIAAGLTAP